MQRSMFIAVALGAAATCADVPGDGDVSATLHLALGGAAAGVFGVEYDVTCDDGTATTVYVAIEDEGLPHDLNPSLAGATFADLFLLVGEGFCDVTATAMADETTPVQACLPASATIQVLAEETTEAILVINCGPEGGGVDIITVVNTVPTVEVTYDPAATLDACETVKVIVKADDVDGDPVEVTFDVEGPAGAQALSWSVEGSVLTFSSGTAGAYAVHVTASDGLGASVTTVTLTVNPVDPPCL